MSSKHRGCGGLPGKCAESVIESRSLESGSSLRLVFRLGCALLRTAAGKKSNGKHKDLTGPGTAEVLVSPRQCLIVNRTQEHSYVCVRGHHKCRWTCGYGRCVENNVIVC